MKSPACSFVLMIALAWSAPGLARAADAKLLGDVAYREPSTLSAEQRPSCQLDLYLPPQGTGYPSILWLHGGGMTGGSRKSAVSQRVARHFATMGVAVAMADYRLNPAVVFPSYVEDTAAAFAWLRTNIAAHGGNPEKVFIGGHSAGAYLALMVALDDRYLAACGLDATALAGVVAISGQTSTHFTVRAERHLGERIIVDDAAPLYHVARRPFPLLLLYAGHDMALRVEENRLLAAALREAGCPTVLDRSYEDRDHGSIISRVGTGEDPVAEGILQFIHDSASGATAR